MNRRSVLIATAALSLIAFPSAAMAYEAPGVTVKVADATPTVDTPVSITFGGAKAGEDVTLTVTSNPASLSSDAIRIAGTKSFTKAADANGVATFSVSFSTAGVFTAQAVGAVSGTLATDQVLTVAGGGNATTTATDTGALAITGSNATTLAIGAGALVVVGGGAVVLTRRRKAAQSA